MMKTLILKLREANFANVLEIAFAGIIIIVSWNTLARVLLSVDATTALPDPGIWQLIYLSVLLFTGWLLLAWQLLHYFWHRLGFISFTHLVSHFNTLALWQQLGFYWASFALFLLAGIACVAAVF
ncbi:hypothetical protein [Pedobacter sp. GR22-10]|uniref:hypothetical protein n=1 Tax=Pedobacter sp. GR22-10 TaxID=2994472 RepID=UPI002245AB43|nr:hypothetical protein [Pedobacter sp. GR22-10]MCX2432349.1 hypothetical protein [Pedobacter sp. GR22-10]